MSKKSIGNKSRTLLFKRIHVPAPGRPPYLQQDNDTTDGTITVTGLEDEYTVNSNNRIANEIHSFREHKIDLPERNDSKLS